MKRFEVRWTWVTMALGLAMAGVALWPAAAVAKPEGATMTPPGDAAAADQPRAIPEGPRPVAKCEQPIHNFGETWMGPTLTHAFVVKNEGDAPLEIIRVKPACGCTAAGEHPKVIAPGQSGEFPFSLNSTKLRGAYDKAITISTNDPVNPELRLKLTGNCKRYVDILPTHAIFGKITDDEAQERVLKITNNTDKDITLSVDPTTDGPFKFELAAVKPGREFELKVSLQQPYKPGDYRNGTTIKTSVAEQDTISIIATATVPERLEVLPETVTLNPITTADRPYVRPLRFTNYGKKPVKIVEAISEDPVLKVSVNERTEGKAYTINVDIPAGYVKPTKENQKIVLKTDDPERPTIEIPVVPLPTSPDAPSAVAQAQQPEQRPAEQMVGKPAPIFSLTTTDGKPLSNDTLKDAVTVLDFWAPNCGFCKKQLPMLENVRKEFADKGVRFVAVNQTMRQQFEPAKVKEVLDSTGFKGELALDNGNVMGSAFQANSFPTLVVLGKSGKVEAVTPGAVPDLESRLKGQLEALLAGKPLPAPAAAPTPTPTPPSKPQESIVGKPAPNFEPFLTQDGKPFDPGSLKDKVTVVDFWAPNCGFCKKQMPRLEPIRKEYEAKGVRFVAVSQTMRQDLGEAKIKETLKETGFGAELVIDKDNKIGPLFGASGFPTMAVIGKTGNVEAINVGNIADLESRLKGQLDALLEGKPLPKELSAAPPQQRPAETMVGQAAPSFSIKTMDGDVVDNAMFAKHAGTVLTFTAPNCGFCKKVAPTVEKLRTEYESKGIRFVNMVQTMRQEFSPEQAMEVFKTAGYNADIAHDPKNEIGGMFKASGFPTTVVVGKDGKIANVFVGAKPDLETTMKAQLDGLIASAAK